MADYIDREKLLKLIPNVKEDKTISLFGAVADIICIVNAVPKEDVAPVVHAHWIDWGIRDDDGNGEYTCSCCDHSDKHSPDIRVPYCWYCGAKMEMEQQK